MKSEKLTASEVEAVGAGLFGPKWPSRLAQAFGVHRQTVYNWRREGAKRSEFAGRLAVYILQQRAALAKAESLII